jgi:hypothetical protein
MSPEAHSRRCLHAVPADPRAERKAGPESQTWPGIDASPDVVRALGAATVMRLRADPGLHEYVCTICERPGLIARPGVPDPGPAGPAGLEVQPASLIVLAFANSLAAVRFAHAGCSPSAVLRILRDPLRLDHRVRATCWLRPNDTGSASAVLLVDNQVRAWPRTQIHDPGDDYERAVQAAGFTITRDLDTPPPVVAGLSVTITLDRGVERNEACDHRPDDGVDPRGCGWVRVQVTHPDGVVFDGVVSAPDVWVAHAHQQGTVTVVTGTNLTLVPLPQVPGGHVAPDVVEQARQFLDGVAATVAAGRAWAGAATLTPTVEETLPDSTVDAGETTPGAAHEIDPENAWRIPWRRLLGIRRSVRNDRWRVVPSSNTSPATRQDHSAAGHSPVERAG